MPVRPNDEDKAREPRRADRALHDQASAKRVYGEPIELDGVKIIPVAAVRRCGRQESAEESGKASPPGGGGA